MTTTEKGRRRIEAILAILDRYPMATTDQLAQLVFAGDCRLARRHLLKLATEEPGRPAILDRVPHPIHRGGSFVWMLKKRGGRRTAHSQKVLHHLQAVAFHIAAARALGHKGARVVPELPWGTGVQPDQTLTIPGNPPTVWAIEHHLGGTFAHGPDYQGFLAEEEFELAPWWKPGIRIGLLVVTESNMVEPIRARLGALQLGGITWRVGAKDQVLRDPVPYLK
jgi:hypothetical protein